MTGDDVLINERLLRITFCPSVQEERFLVLLYRKEGRRFVRRDRGDHLREKEFGRTRRPPAPARGATFCPINQNSLDFSLARSDSRASGDLKNAAITRDRDRSFV